MFLINKVLMFKTADDAAEWISYLYKRYPDTKYLTKSGEKKYFFHLYDGNADMGPISHEDFTENLPILAEKLFELGKTLTFEELIFGKLMEE